MHTLYGLGSFTSVPKVNTKIWTSWFAWFCGVFWVKRIAHHIYGSPQAAYRKSYLIVRFFFPLLLVWSNLVVMNLSWVCFLFFCTWIYAFIVFINFRKKICHCIQKFYFCLPLLFFMVHSRFIQILECLNLCSLMLYSLFLSAFPHPHVSVLMLSFYC